MTSVRSVVSVSLAAGAVALMVGCSTGDSSESERTIEVTQAPTSGGVSVDADRQGYLDAVNALCDDLLPKVIDATHGGSTDVPAKEWVETWPAHQALLDGFDADLAEVAVPEAAADLSQVVAAYVVWATGIDEARIAAARQGEDAWRAELAAEADILSTPELVALAPAGFHDSCQAR